MISCSVHDRQVCALPSPRYTLGQSVEAHVDEEADDVLEPGRQWINAWCKGVVVGCWWHYGQDFTLSSALDSNWHYQVLILEWDESRYFNTGDEPRLIQFSEGELS